MVSIVLRSICFEMELFLGVLHLQSSMVWLILLIFWLVLLFASTPTTSGWCTTVLNKIRLLGLLGPLNRRPGDEDLLDPRPQKGITVVAEHGHIVYVAVGVASVQVGELEKPNTDLIMGATCHMTSTSISYTQSKSTSRSRVKSMVAVPSAYARPDCANQDSH